MYSYLKLNSMVGRITSTLILLFYVSILWAQPMVGYYFGRDREVNRGRKFKSIEETYEVKLKEVNVPAIKIVKTFDVKGNITSKISYGAEGGVSSDMKWIYNPNGDFLERKHRYFVNMVGWREELVRIEYNPDTRMPEKITVEREGKMLQRATVTIDTLGRIEMSQVYNASGALAFIEKLIYLQPANIIRVLVYRPNNQFYGTWSYPIDPGKEFAVSAVSQEKYDNGDIRLETLTDASKGDQAYYYEYKYDSQGNWIEKDTYQVNLGKSNKIKKKKLEHRITRKITYQ